MTSRSDSDSGAGVEGWEGLLVLDGADGSITISSSLIDSILGSERTVEDLARVFGTIAEAEDEEAEAGGAALRNPRTRWLDPDTGAENPSLLSDCWPANAAL
jgi:hypothetical protein